MRLYITILFSLLSGFAFSEPNFDSLLTIASTTNSETDFEKIDFILEANQSEYTSLLQKKLIVLSALRTKELGFEFLHGKFKFKESIIHTVMGDLGSAMRMVQESLEIFAKYKSVQIMRCYNTMGSMVASQGHHKLGLNYLNKAFAVHENFENDTLSPYLNTDNHLVIGYIYILMDNYDKAEIHLNTALTLSKELDYTSSENYVYLNFATIALKKGNYSEALEISKKSLQYAETNNLDSQVPIALTKIATAYYESGNSNAALSYYLKAEEHAIRIGLSGRLTSIYEKIISIYRNKLQYKNASDYQLKLQTLTNQIKQKEHDERLEIHQVSFELNEKNARISKLAVEQRLASERNTSLKIILIITAGAAFLFLLTILLLFNRFRLKKKVQVERALKAYSTVKLSALKSQMNPHFVFNSLNSIQDLILTEDSELSYNYVTKFSELVRSILKHSDLELIPFSDEVDALKLYIELESLRFQNTIQLKFETNGIEDIEIPPLLIQPFIENAFKHGLLHKKGVKELAIQFELKDMLICTIRDNGIGRKKSKEIKSRQHSNHQSFATESINDRLSILKKLHGDNLGFTYYDLKKGNVGTGTIVKLYIPFKRKY